LHYVDWGNASAPLLLLIHGGRDHCRSWDWVAERFRGRFHIIAPDLRGHGYSDWSGGGAYSQSAYIQDVAQLVYQKRLAPVAIIGHSLGGSIGLLYAGLFPETVTKIVAIEGLGRAPNLVREYSRVPIEERLQRWIVERREGAGRAPRRFSSMDEATARMRAANARLTEEQGRLLTSHGSLQNEDGTYSWKFDPEIRFGGPAVELSYEDQYRLWSRITCSVLLVRGMESWASDPIVDGRIRHFRDARLINVKGAGHWVHHDQLEEFVEHVRAFLEQ
jgi:pimeloyl-ACP methyl ester carboxylesterase